MKIMKLWLWSLLLCQPLAISIPLQAVLDFMQRVWPFSYFAFTEAARTRRRILAQLATSRESFYADPEVRKAIIVGGGQ